MKTTRLRQALHDFRWRGVDLLPYKADATAPFRDVTRQVLFDDAAQLSQLRYFEIAANGCSTLERHQHGHAVIILRGRGRCLVGTDVFDVAVHDLVTVPPLTWHQFRANVDEPLGFLCMVNAERDRPQLPTADELQQLRGLPDIADFLGPVT
jgi:mannose-6-phosphate isomerase-like protein (cupin superfamily)